MSRTWNSTNKTHTHTLCGHRTIDLEGNFVGKNRVWSQIIDSSSHVIFIIYEQIFTEKKITGITFWAAFKKSDSKWCSGSDVISCRQTS